MQMLDVILLRLFGTLSNLRVPLAPSGTPEGRAKRELAPPQAETEGDRRQVRYCIAPVIPRTGNRYGILPQSASLTQLVKKPSSREQLSSKNRLPTRSPLLLKRGQSCPVGSEIL